MPLLVFFFLVRQIAEFFFSAKLKCLFALTVTPRGVVTLEVVLRKGQRLLDRGPYTGACTEAALAPHATTAHRAAPPSPACSRPPFLGLCAVAA